MIVQKTSNVDTNITKSHDFKISDNSIHLFRMLSDFLYSNKEAAVLHELSANAVDEHKRFGIPETPIEIVAPNALDPNLTIRDFGEGLAEDMVYHLLATYGESGEHKRNSNEFFGAWGIGSKSPAAVTKNWLIRSYHKGKCTTYQVFISDKGAPSIVPQTTADCTQSGLEIVIPVKPNDIRKWIDLFSGVYQYYTVRPNFKNVKPTFNKKAWFFNEPTWTGAQKPDYYQKKHTAIISYRGYTLDTDKLRKDIKDPHVLALLNISALAFEYHFNTGELELSLSRETIQYTKHTVAAIENRLLQVYAELKAKFVAALGTPTNSLEYREAMYVASEAIFGDKSAFGDYQSKALVDLWIQGNSFGITTDKISIYTLTGVDQVKHRPKMFNGKQLSTMRKSFTAWKTYSAQYAPPLGEMAIKINQLPRMRFVDCDIRDADTRVRHDGFNGLSVLIYNGYNFPAELSKWVIKASTLKPVIKARVPRAARVKIESDIFELRRNSFIRTMPDKNAKSVYVRFTDARTRDSMEKPATPFDKFTMNKLVERMESYGYTVLAIRKKDSAPKWMKSITEEITHWIATVDQKKLTESYQVEVYSNSNNSKSLGILLALKPDFADTTLLGKTLKFYHEVVCKFGATSTCRHYWDQYESFCELSGVKPTHPVIVDWKKMQEAVFDRYPMLKYSDYYNKPSASEVEQYVNLVEGIKI